MRSVTRWTLYALVAGLVGACSDSTGGGSQSRRADSLNFVLLAQNAPTLCADSIGFWAYQGQSADTALVFPEIGSSCAGSTEDFVRLKLDAASLLRYPDGTLFQPGDSVFISLKWIGSDSILFKLDPSGLVFDPAHPAELKIEYTEAGPDLNHDGEIDHQDTVVQRQIDIWRQPTLADRYSPVGTAKIEDANEVDARLNGFSRFALAY